MTDDDLKSQESIMLNLIRGLLHDLGRQHSVSEKETDRDADVISSRTQAEGLGFLTKTLPKFGKALDKALLTGEFTPMSEFGHDKGTAYPRLFRRLTELVFVKEGMLREEPDVAAIQSLRQVSYLFYKYQLPYHDLTVRLSIEEFVEVDQSIKPLSSDVDTIATIYHAQEVLNEVFKESFAGGSIINLKDLAPKNGPGAVAHGEKPWHRYEPRRCYNSLENLVPYGSMFYYNDRHLFDHWDSYFGMEHPTGSGTAVLLAVPKDSRGPRLISKEPQEYMVYQQALRVPLVDHIETHPLTAGQVNFADQGINGALALRASKDASLATIDLSAASDRLSCELVEALFEDLPALQHYLLSSRTDSTRTPDDHIIFTRKYAPMGSALTFPIQSIVFYSLLVGDLVRGGMPLREAAKSVWVYGDDIIVPNKYAPEAMAVLERVGLKVNTEKSCYSGHFRESCGVDAYLGVDITPVKIKRLWQVPSRSETRGKLGRYKGRNAKRRETSRGMPEITTLQAWVSYSDLLFQKGYWEASDVVRRQIEEAVGHLPAVTSTSPLLGFQVWSRDHAIEANKALAKWSHDLQCSTYRGFKSQGKSGIRLTCGWKRLLNYAWNKPPRESERPLVEEEPFNTGLFTDRHSVAKKHVVVAESAL